MEKATKNHTISIEDEIEFAKLRYDEYHQRLLQEYDLSWQQLKISMYIVSILLVLYGSLFSYQIKIGSINQIQYVLIAISAIGVFISTSSLIILIGSLKSAQSIRICLAKIEEKFDTSGIFSKTNRYLTISENDTVRLAGKKEVDLISFGKIFLQSIVIAFWVFLSIISVYHTV